MISIFTILIELVFFVYPLFTVVNSTNKLQVFAIIIIYFTLFCFHKKGEDYLLSHVSKLFNMASDHIYKIYKKRVDPATFSNIIITLIFVLLKSVLRKFVK